MKTNWKNRKLIITIATPSRPLTDEEEMAVAQGYDLGVTFSKTEIVLPAARYQAAIAKARQIEIEAVRKVPGTLVTWIDG